MIVQEIVTLHNKQFKHTFSYDKKYIKQLETGAIYSEAYDVMHRNFNYVETDTELTEEDLSSLVNPDET